MGLQIVRTIIATINLALGSIVAYSFINDIIRYDLLSQTPLGERLFGGFVLLFAALAVTAGGFLLRRRTQHTGLRMHFGLAHLWLLSAIGFAFGTAWSNPDHAIRPWDLTFFYVLTAISGIWFFLGGTLHLLMRRDAAKNGTLTLANTVREDNRVEPVRPTTLQTPLAQATTAGGTETLLLRSR